MGRQVLIRVPFRRLDVPQPSVLLEPLPCGYVNWCINLISEIHILSCPLLNRGIILMLLGQLEILRLLVQDIVQVIFRIFILDMLLISVLPDHLDLQPLQLLP